MYHDVPWDTESRELWFILSVERILYYGFLWEFIAAKKVGISHISAVSDALHLHVMLWREALRKSSS